VDFFIEGSDAAPIVSDAELITIRARIMNRAGHWSDLPQQVSAEDLFGSTVTVFAGTDV